MDGAADRDSDIGEESPMSHHEEGEGEISEGEPEAEDSSDEGRGALEHRDLLDRLRLHRPDKVDLRVRDDFESLKNSLHPHLSSLASLAQNTPLSSLPQVGGNPLLGPPSAPFSLPMGFPFQHPGPFLTPPRPRSSGAHCGAHERRAGHGPRRLGVLQQFGGIHEQSTDMELRGTI